MATNGSALVSADVGIPIETTDVALPDTLDVSSYTDLGITPTNVVGPIDTSIDSTGDEGYVDSAGSLGGGNSTSSNDPNATDPAPGSPTSSFSSVASTLEDLTKLATTGAQLANAIEGPSRSTLVGRTGQSAPVRSSKPSFLQSLFGSASGQAAGVNASATGATTTGFATVGFIAAIILGLGFLVWRAVR